jgi:hypothetical protein
MKKISPVRANARAHMLLEAAGHLRLEVCDNALEREEADKLASRLEKEAQGWFARGMSNPEDYEAACEAESPTQRRAYSIT